jgi:hypothetical protein
MIYLLYQLHFQSLDIDVNMITRESTKIWQKNICSTHLREY